MNTTSILNRKKIKTLALIGILILSSVILPTVIAGIPPTIPGNEEYMSDFGVLHSDTYALYPYEETSLNIGFSKYGEMIDETTTIGLEYNGIDVFANSMIEPYKWFSGWMMEIHYTEGGYLKNIWTYALFSDRTIGGVGGDWKNGQMTRDASHISDDHGGRRTNGWATSDDIRLIYDGPRKAIYLLSTTIWDKDPANDGTPLVQLTIQLVFNKVKKYVMEIKDIKRIDNNKMTGPFQIEFSQRAEWDLGDSTRPLSYAEFYDDLTTKYWKHPFYYPGDADPVTFDLAQIIDEDETMVGFAAFWPPLISKWVAGTDWIQRVSEEPDVPSLLKSMETFEHYVTLPTNADDLFDPLVSIDGTTGEIIIKLPRESVEYPRGEGEWDDAPWVGKKDPNGFAKLIQIVDLIPGSWRWDDSTGPNGAVRIQQWSWGDEYVVVFKRWMKGHVPHTSTYLGSMPDDLFQSIGTTYGMAEEPDVPYVFGEWDFDLDYDNPQNSTHQFRAVSIYGLTDYHDAVDPDMNPAGEFRIDKEVIYQLNEVFNPWDLNDAAHKDTFRWAQKGPITNTIVLESHLYDKYGNERGGLIGEHLLVIPDIWGDYFDYSEKVLLYDVDGVLEDILLTRPDDYTRTGWTLDISGYDSRYDYYKVLYSTTLDKREENHWLHDGRWEWITIGKGSLAADSSGAAMLSATWADWKNKETWLSGLDIQAEIYGPTIPYVMRRFSDGLDGRLDFLYNPPDDLRSAFKDDWSTPDGYEGESTIHPYAISSSNIMVIGGPLVNLAADYFNDFTDAFVFSTYGEGFYAPGCWARTTQDYFTTTKVVNDVPDDELWYSSPDVHDDVGYAMVSTYMDINGTIGFIVYGYTAEDTYYASYALRGGGLEWLQYLQEGVTTIIVEIDYSDIHPVTFHVREFLGTFTECTGAETNFKTQDYYHNILWATQKVEDAAEHLGLGYKLVDIEFCGQVHPDP